MASQGCGFSENIASYVACELDEATAENFDSHLTACESCRRELASLIDQGCGPGWLDVILPSTGTIAQSIDETFIRRQGADTVQEVSKPSVLPRRDTIAGNARYRAVRRVGGGGMGIVWEGWDTIMRRRVALKELRADGNQANLAVRLMQEASSLARLSHPHIVAVYEVFVAKERPTMVMEFIDGPTLAQWRGDKVLSERQVVDLLEPLARAVEHAHQNGVVHRDLKPSNVLLGSSIGAESDGEGLAKLELASLTPKLTDFGLARILDEQNLTQTGEFLGTPAYMAPEQASAETRAIGPATDVYGLGATLYEMLVGTPPHVADDSLATLMLVRDRDPVPPRLLRPGLSRDLETICLKCLRKSPLDRYPSAGALADDLRAFAEGRPIAARPISSIAKVGKWCLRHRALTAIITLSIGLLVSLVIGSVFYVRMERTLRMAADEAAQSAKTAERRATEQKTIAERVTRQIQSHFQISMETVDSIARLANTLQMNRESSVEQIAKELEDKALATFAEFVKALPEPGDWTLGDAHLVIRYAQLMHQRQPHQVTECLRQLDRVLPELERLDRASPDQHEIESLLHCHAGTMANVNAAHGNFAQAAHWGKIDAGYAERQIERVPENWELRQAFGHTLFYVSKNLLHSEASAEAVTYAKRAVEMAKEVVEKSPGIEANQFDVLVKLSWLGNCQKCNNDEIGFRDVETEFLHVANRIPVSSPFFPQIEQLRQLMQSYQQHFKAER